MTEYVIKAGAYAREKVVSISRDFLWYYTFAIILLKSVIFIGFIIAQGDIPFDLRTAYHTVPSLWIYGSFIAVLLSFAFLLRGKARMWYLVLFNLAFSTLFVFDLWYYRGFGTMLNLHLFSQTANLQNMGDCIYSMARRADAVFLFDGIILLLMVLFTKHPFSKGNRNLPLFAAIFFLASGYIAYVHHKVDIVEGGQNQILFRICWTPKETITNLSPLGFHLYDTYNYAQESRPLVLREEEKQEIEAWFENKKEDLPENGYKALFKGKNLIHIQFESLENFVIGRKINGQEITPNINKLLKNSIYFPNIYEQVHNGTSSDSDLMVNTSVYPVRSGSTFFRYPYNTYNSLPQLMEKHGYDTLAIHSDKGAFWNWMEATEAIGFDKCLDVESFTVDEEIGLGLSDGSYLRQVGDVLVKQKQPFYSFVVTMTSHGPFDLPEKYRELKLDKELDKTKLGGYFQSMHYTDKHIGLLIEKLRQDGALENSVITIAGDHCGVHKYYQDELESIQPRESWWYDKNKCIPLIAYQEDGQEERKETIGGQIDIMPTIAYLMGVDEEEYAQTAMGRNLLRTSRSFAVLSDRTFVGQSTGEEEKQAAINGIDLADKIVRSNYFKAAGE